MKFYIEIEHDRKRYKFLVEKLPSDLAFDYYQVSGNNGAITFKNNGPVIRRHGLKHKPEKWQVYKNDIRYSTFKEKIITAIKAKLQ